MTATRTERRPGPHPPGVIVNPDGTANYAVFVSHRDQARWCSTVGCSMILKAHGGVTDEVRTMADEARAVLDPGLELLIDTGDALIAVPVPSSGSEWTYRSYVQKPIDDGP